MRPISKGYYTVADLISGAVDLEMVARCNDTMDMEHENERRYLAHMKGK